MGTERAHNDNENRIECSRLTEKSLLSKSHIPDEDDVNDDGAGTDLRGAKITNIGHRKAENHVQDMVHERRYLEHFFIALIALDGPCQPRNSSFFSSSASVASKNFSSSFTARFGKRRLS